MNKINEVGIFKEIFELKIYLVKNQGAKVFVRN